jgi:hypothetical protein
MYNIYSYEKKEKEKELIQKEKKRLENYERKKKVIDNI